MLIYLGLEPSACSPFWVEFSSIYVGFASGQFLSAEMLLEAFRGAEAISSVEPICRLVFIGLASAGRCKVGLLVFQWLFLRVCPFEYSLAGEVTTDFISNMHQLHLFTRMAI